MAKEINASIHENMSIDAAKVRESKREMLRRLHDEEKISLRLPTDHVSNEDTVEVGLNGILYRIRRGVTVDAPYPIYLILKESGKYDL